MSASPRVLFVMGANGTGGTELQARALVAALRSRGVATHVIVLDGQHGLSGLPDDTESMATARPGLVRSVVTYAQAVRRVRKTLRSGDFDVIHAVHARGYIVAAAAALGVRDVRRVAWRRNLGIHLDGRSAALSRLMERSAIRATDVVLVNSNDVRDYWMSSHGLPAEKSLVVPNLLQKWRFEVERTPSRQPVVILAVGGLRAVKGHDVLLRAAAELRRPDVEVVILGEGEQRGSLTELAANLGVRFALPGVQADPRPWLARATIYVQPSRSEGSSNAVLEAMAAGVPIVASDVGGMRELLDDTGSIVSPGDVEGLRREIERLLSDASVREALGGAARRRAREHFSEESVVDTTLRVYRGELPCPSA